MANIKLWGFLIEYGDSWVAFKKYNALKDEGEVWAKSKVRGVFYNLSGEWQCFPELMCVYSERGCNFTLQRRTGFESCWLWRWWGPEAAQPGRAWAPGPRQGRAGWQTMPGPSGTAQLHSIPFLHVSDKARVPLSPESRQRRCCPGGWRGEVAQQTLGSYWNEHSAEWSVFSSMWKSRSILPARGGTPSNYTEAWALPDHCRGGTLPASFWGSGSVPLCVFFSTKSELLILCQGITHNLQQKSHFPYPIDSGTCSVYLSTQLIRAEIFADFHPELRRKALRPKKITFLWNNKSKGRCQLSWCQGAHCMEWGARGSL